MLLQHTDKTVHFAGKHNIDKMKKMIHGAGLSEKAIRLNMMDLDLTLLPNKIQLDYIIQLYMAVPLPPSNRGIVELLERELHKKINGYKTQDIKKALYNTSATSALITFAEVVEKLVASKLNCVYCCQPVYVLYKDVRDPTQWTLDRKDNDIGHSHQNTVIACLKCNLQRRRIDEDKFMFTKRLKICKMDSFALAPTTS
jgi:hypothetical protein